MKQVLSLMWAAIKEVIRLFFANDMDVMSYEVREILANKEDAKKYREAVDRITAGEEKVTVHLSSRTLTLIR